MNCSEHDHANAGATQARAGASEWDDAVEKLIAAADKLTGIPDNHRTAIAFAIRCAYGMGYEQARSDLRRAA